MKKGTAMEGFIRDDGTIRPIEHYDDTELRSKIQTNTDDIDNLKSGKADKVNDAVSGNLAGLDSTGNLTDSGKKASDFALSGHAHSNYLTNWHGETSIPFTAENGSLALLEDEEYDELFDAIQVGGSGRMFTCGVIVEDDEYEWRFMAMCYTNAIPRTAGWEKKVVIYLGDRTISLSRDSTNENVTVLDYVKTIDEILEGSAES